MFHHTTISMIMIFPCKPQPELSVRKIDILSDTQQWDSFFTNPAQHHLSSEHLKFYTKNTTVDSFCFQVLKQEQVVGQIYLQSASIPASDLLQYASSKAARFCFLSFVSNFKINCQLSFLVCGNIFKSNQAGYELLPEVSPAEVFQTLIDFLENSKYEYPFVGLLLKDCPAEVPAFKGLLPYKKDLTMQLSLEPKWLSIEDYVADLDKKYRNRYKKISKNFAGLAFQELSTHEIEQYSDRIYDLYAGVTKKQDFKIGELNKNYFLEKKRLLNQKFKVYGVFKDGKMIAFSSHIFENTEQMEIHYIGFDYEYNESHNLYFNILFHGLAHAISHRITVLELGRTAEVAKASLGAKPHYKINYLYFRKNRYQLSFKLGSKILKNNWEIELRNPFKEPAKVAAVAE